MIFAVYAYTTSTFPYDQFSICGSLTMRHPGHVAVLLEIDENIEIMILICSIVVPSLPSPRALPGGVRRPSWNAIAIATVFTRDSILTLNATTADGRAGITRIGDTRGT
jgi:hypothetical protein